LPVEEQPIQLNLPAEGQSFQLSNSPAVSSSAEQQSVQIVTISVTQLANLETEEQHAQYT
jgi:hypothetical protein